MGALNILQYGGTIYITVWGHYIHYSMGDNMGALNLCSSCALELVDNLDQLFFRIIFDY